MTQNEARSTADVVVVGAGVSGLQTAHKLQQSGASCIVLEASGQIGGIGFAHDGFNAESHPRTYAMAVELGLLQEKQSTPGKAMLEGFEAFESYEQPAVSKTQCKL